MHKSTNIKKALTLLRMRIMYMAYTFW